MAQLSTFIVLLFLTVFIGSGAMASFFWLLGGFSGGPEGNRTPDLLIANETRYQLRHRPEARRIPPVTEHAMVESEPGGL